MGAWGAEASDVAWYHPCRLMLAEVDWFKRFAISAGPSAATHSSTYAFWMHAIYVSEGPLKG